MSNTPPRKPRFLSSVPAQQEIQTPRFASKPAPAPPIRPLAGDAAKSEGAKSDAAKNEAAEKPAAQAPAAPARAANPAGASAAALPPHPTIQLPPAQVNPPAGANANVNSHSGSAQGESSAQLDLVRSRLAASIESLRQQSERLAEQARADVMEVAFQIARRIVEVEVRQSPEPLFALIRASLGQLAAARKITLRVCPQDLDAVRGPRGQETTAALAMAELEVVADAGLEPGECVIDSDLGQIDGRLANRFAELRRHVAEASEGAA